MAMAYLQLLFLATLLPLAKGSKPLYKYCSLSFTGELMRQASINSVLADLIANANKGSFSKSVYGDRKDSAQGLLQCRADISSLECLSCAQKANKFLRTTCSKYADGRVWYDHCFLRYGINDFFGSVDYEHVKVLHSSHVVKNSTAFDFVVGLVLSDAIAKATTVYRIMFGDAKRTFIERKNMTIYGMAQCTQDLPLLICKSCLRTAEALIPKCCNGRIGCRVLYSSCGIRYEINNFFEP